MKFLFVLLALLGGCTDFVKKTQPSSYNQTINSQNGLEHFHLFFGHNINGETHPCGCRHFPLGGLAQVAGILHEYKKSGPIIYVDTGDTLFPSSVIPKSLNKSLTFIADEVISSLNDLGLNYFLPGDQDFAMGEKHLIDLSHKMKLDFLITNLNNNSKIKHKKYASIKLPNDRKLFILGLVAREVINGSERNLFSNEEQALSSTLKEIKSMASEEDIIILLSHSGIENDKKYAEKFPRLNWIIGSHSQSFLKEPVEIGNTKIVQVLSRNHYLGHITIPFSGKEQKYEIVEVRDEWKDKLPNNPFVKRLENHKAQLKKIQEEEQEEMNGQSLSGMRLPTASSCIECHSDQHQFWQSTAHSLAIQTLIQNNEEKNPNCIGCHTVGYMQANGFKTFEQLVMIDGHPMPIKETKKYWNSISNFFKPYGKKSIRELASSDRSKISKKWEIHDRKLKVTHNFANVQCLNCHDKSPKHPFEMDSQVTKDMQSKCLNCHTRDQSPEWYTKDNKGLAGKLNKDVYNSKLKQVACPK